MSDLAYHATQRCCVHYSYTSGHQKYVLSVTSFAKRGSRGVGSAPAVVATWLTGGLCPGFPWFRLGFREVNPPRKLLQIVSAIGPVDARNEQLLQSVKKLLHCKKNDILTTLDQLLTVRQASALLTASSRFRLATDTLAVQLTLPLAACAGDLHPQVSAPLPGAPKKTPLCLEWLFFGVSDGAARYGSRRGPGCFIGHRHKSIRYARFRHKLFSAWFESGQPSRFQRPKPIHLSHGGF
jgi:hypothetical protein